ncbi:GTPase IMAP family member 6-like [Sinocyclocheilus grahami]|uniref:GTPase IMAP family member 6-like n=1 Tax=Sinocyclocheilus grahami TaxID=75366 RepID=UPI0007ACA347|nr:PREDICTED: GTPase IMAP family member 6-like [Sinocyclocheilus grahami]XP_016117168.1 PREDICTED: GTPase IMAP family member 6-like [Sinocyclocheilus grahami]
MACDSQDLRIVLLGVSSAGTNSIGNAILGREVFKESRTTESEIQRGRVEDRNISIINTPGFVNTHLTEEELQEQMMKSLDLSDPGPHVFLLVIDLETFEEDERNIVEEIFGVQALKFTMVLFTGRELISKKKWQEFEFSENFQRLVSKCRAYHVINSKNEINQTHIKKLLKKIDEFIKQNKQHFNNGIDSVSQTRSTKEKKKQEENHRKKEQEKGRQEQAMQETFEMNSAMEGATVFEPEKIRLRKKTHVYEETGLQEMASLDRFLTFSHERMGKENEVKKPERSWKKSQKKQKTAEEKYPTQPGGRQYLAVCFRLFCVLLLVFIILQNISITAERDRLKSCKNTVQEFNQTINSLHDKNSELNTEKDQWYQFTKNQGEKSNTLTRSSVSHFLLNYGRRARTK